MSEEQVRAFEGALAAQVDTVRTAVAQLEATVDLAAASCGGIESELALAEILDAITPGVKRRKGAEQETADVEVGGAARQLEAAEAVDERVRSAVRSAFVQQGRRALGRQAFEDRAGSRLVDSVGLLARQVDVANCKQAYGAADQRTLSAMNNFGASRR